MPDGWCRQRAREVFLKDIQGLGHAPAGKRLRAPVLLFAAIATALSGCVSLSGADLAAREPLDLCELHLDRAYLAAETRQRLDAILLRQQIDCANERASIEHVATMHSTISCIGSKAREI